MFDAFKLSDDSKLAVSDRTVSPPFISLRTFVSPPVGTLLGRDGLIFSLGSARLPTKEPADESILDGTSVAIEVKGGGGQKNFARELALWLLAASDLISPDEVDESGLM